MIMRNSNRQPFDDTSRVMGSRLARMLSHADHRRCYAVLVLVELGVLAVAAWRAPGALALGLVWLGGVAAWTLLEYLLHRFVFHIPRTSPLSALGSRQHLDHHDAPSRLPITKPLYLTLPAIVIGVGVVSTLGPLGLAVAAGLVAGYLGYELAHVAAHVLVGDHPLPNLQALHLQHHIEPGRAFGITNGVWDRVFGTQEVQR